MTKAQIKAVMQIFSVDEDSAIELVKKGINPLVAEKGVNLVENDMNEINHKFNGEFREYSHQINSISEKMEQVVHQQMDQRHFGL